ncbi:MAG: hypothetical protein LQ344_007056 [Seirophora lacunosa]|nr:MAG: hypothetical protein LQ344_007056 [Seirophora lacunosa]
MPGPPSASVGQPPLTADDTLIVHGWQVLLGMGRSDPSLGLTIAKRPPPPGQTEGSDTTSIAVGSTNKALIWGMDDWAIIAGTLAAMILPVIYCYKLVNAGGGKHVYDVTYWELANHQAMAPVTFGLFYVAVSLIKISIVFFYMRLSAFASRAWTWAHRIFIAALTIGAIISVVLAFVQCDPYTGDIRLVGRKDVKPKCIPLFNMGVGYSVWHILSDCLLCVVPFLMLWRVQMKFWTKFSVCIAGVIGLGNVAVTVARVFDQASVQARRGPFDLTYTATSTFGYSITELTLGVMTANLPVLSVIVTKTVEMLTGSIISRGRTADTPGSNGRPRFYKRKLHDGSETEFGALRDGGAQPTIRHDVEYVSLEEGKAHRQTSPGKIN